MLKKYFASPFIVFPAASVIFFWPVSLLLFTLKNDALTYYYPVRTLISDALRNGELPLWTPFINMGYPLHADMQSGAWNPVIWLFSFLSNYSLAAFHYELLFYIAFAGIGFYYLCRHFGSSKTISYTIAFAYQFSGFMIDTVQFFTCISAACYLPWIILFFRRMMLDYKTSDALCLSFFLFLLFTGGYPSLFIITGYVMVAYGLFIFLSGKNKRLFLKKVVPAAFIGILFFVLLSLPAILSFAQQLTMISRGKHQPLSFVLENSMNPFAIISLFAPFATTANNSWLNSSVLMRNTYVGIIPMLFFIYAVFKAVLKRNKELLFFFFLTVIMFGIALGKFFFLRQAFYYLFPLMDSFRHPALFRLFGIFFLLLIAASALKEWQSVKEIKEKLFKKILFFFTGAVILAGITAIIFLHNKIPGSDLKISNLKNLLSQFNFQQRLLLQLPFIIILLSLAHFAIVKKRSLKLICLITIADLFFATQLNLPVTIIGSKKFENVESLINRNPRKFPIPGNETIEQNSVNSSGKNIITGSTLSFIKKIGRNDYYITPGNLSLQEQFYESKKKDSIFHNPVLYVSNLFPFRSESAGQQDTDFFTDKSFINSNRDGDSVVINNFSANSMNATIRTNKPGMLVYLQNNYPGWKAYVDGVERNILQVNISFMGFIIPEGKHKIEFRYRPRNIIIAWYISLGGLSFLLFYMTNLFFKRRSSSKK